MDQTWHSGCSFLIPALEKKKSQLWWYVCVGCISLLKRIWVGHRECVLPFCSWLRENSLPKWFPLPSTLTSLLFLKEQPLGGNLTSGSLDCEAKNGEIEGSRVRPNIYFCKNQRRGNTCSTTQHLKMLQGVLRVCATGLPWKAEAVASWGVQWFFFFHFLPPKLLPTQT